MTRKKQTEVRIDYVALSEVKKWPRNPKLHALDALATSMDRWGYVQPLLMDETTGQLVAGHGRVEALEKRQEEGLDPPDRVELRDDGEWMVPVVRGVAFRDEHEAEAYLIADNRLAEKGGWNDADLLDMLRRLQEAHATTGIGWTEKEIAKRIKAAEAPASGQTPEQALATYTAGEVKQVTLYFDGKEFDAVQARLKAIQTETKLGTNSELLLLLLESYENATTDRPDPT